MGAGAGPNPKMQPAHAFEPLVCIVDFHHARGPEIEQVFGGGRVDTDTETETETDTNADSGQDQEDCHGFDPADWTLIPYMALPDGAHAVEEEFSYFSVVYRGCTNADDGSQARPPPRSVFGVACARQLDSSQLLYRPTAVTRSAVQKAVVALTALPQTLGQQRERLRVVTRAWFAQRDFRDRDILQRFQESLVQAEKSFDGDEPGFGLSPREVVRTFRYQTLVLFKCLLLQPKMLFFGSNCERVCQVQFSLLSLIPGLVQSLQDCADVRMNSYAENLKRPDGVRTSDRASLLAYMGIPLQIFGSGSIFSPYMPLQKLDTLTDQGTKSYVVGSTNTLLLSQKERYCDVLVNLDDNTVSILSPQYRSLLALSAADRRWIDFITQAVRTTWDDADPAHPSTHGYAGSEEFIRLQFEEYLLAMLSCAKYHTFLQTRKPGDPKSLLAEVEGDPSADFVPAYLEAWRNTENHALWERVTDKQLFDIVEPRHPTAGALSMEDIQRRLARQVAELHLDERLSATRDVVGRRFADGKSSVTTALNRVWADIEVMREAQRKRADGGGGGPVVVATADVSGTFAPSTNPTTSTASLSIAQKLPRPDLVQAQTSVAAAGQRASAYLSSWGSWASEKRRTGWRSASGGSAAGGATES